MIIDGHSHLGADLFFYLNGFHPYGQDLPTLVTEGRRQGVDRWVVFPMPANLTFNLGAMRRGRRAGRGLERVPYAFENERMLREINEAYPDLGRDTLPFAMLDPQREARAQVKHLRALRRRFRFHGLKIQGTMIRSRVSALLTTGRCFLDFAAEFNLPFIIHSSVAAGDVWSQAADILRVAERTPQVRFCLAHSCRFDRECLDRVAALPNTWFDCSAHRIHCAGVTRGLGFVAAAARRLRANYRDPAAALLALAQAYPTKLIWGSDAPFQSYIDRRGGRGLSLRSTYAEEAACLRALPAPLRRAAACDNLLALLQPSDEKLLARR